MGQPARAGTGRTRPSDSCPYATSRQPCRERVVRLASGSQVGGLRFQRRGGTESPLPYLAPRQVGAGHPPGRPARRLHAARTGTPVGALAGGLIGAAVGAISGSAVRSGARRTGPDERASDQVPER
jgi:hypothetical protein